MHVKYSSRLTKLTVVLSLFFVVILFAETMMDYATRGWSLLAAAAPAVVADGRAGTGRGAPAV